MDEQAAYQQLKNKFCTKCRELKVLSLFPLNKMVKSGYAAECKACRSSYNSERYKQKSDSIRAYQVEYNKKNLSYITARQKAYVEKNLEKTKEYQKEYSKRNRQAGIERCRQWYQHNKDSANNWRKNNPEKVKAIHAKRRARKKQAEGFFVAEDIKRLLNLQKKKCAICRCSLGRYHVDHIIPLAKGGSNWPSNLQILCITCNHSKGAKDPIEFMQSLGRLL